jgi:hypothetical protein
MQTLGQTTVRTTNRSETSCYAVASGNRCLQQLQKDVGNDEPAGLEWAA